MMRDPAVDVQPMGPADVPYVAALEAASFPTAATDVGPIALREERLHEELARPWTRGWVVRDGIGRAIAFLVAWHVADELHVLNVATDPAHRRRGAGMSLVAAAVEYARAEQVRHVRLELRRSNAPALRMYRSAGFFVVAVRRKYYPDDEDALDMDLVLDASGNVMPHQDEADPET
jgi:ribosomal-protein-alanine N-acetyltransferase